MMGQILLEKNNICFIANFYKTFYFHEIAKQLRNSGFIIYWIVTKEEQYQFLKKYYPENNLLLINRKNCSLSNLPIDDFKINELIYGDRVFRHEKVNGIRFLTNIQLPIYDFLAKNKISTIFGEKTWAHELLIHRIISKRVELKCKFYLMATTRIPNGRILFFEDEKETIIVKTGFNEDFKATTKIKIEKPDYLALNDNILKSSSSLWGRLKRVKKYLTNENIEKNDPNVNINKLVRFKIPFMEELNRFMYQFIKKSEYSLVSYEKYIFFGFHKQPEASVDVCGRYFENQFENVINLWKQLPVGWKLVIKEHSNAVGDRTYWFYKKILNYPNIILVNEKCDSHLLIKNAQLVATNTGTMGLEAALIGVPAITFSKVFFNKHNFCKNIAWVDLEKYSSLIDLRNEILNQVDNSEQYSKYVFKHSFEGKIGDINSNPAIVDFQNIERVTNAIINIINH